MNAIDVWAQITTERMAKRPWLETLLRVGAGGLRRPLLMPMSAGRLPPKMPTWIAITNATSMPQNTKSTVFIRGMAAWRRAVSA